MVSSVNGSSTVQQALPQASTSVSAVKRSIDVEKMAGQALVNMIEQSDPQKGNSIDIKV